MNFEGLQTHPLTLKLRSMSEDDLWWIYVHHRQECGHEFWREIENRKAAGILCNASPFWIVGESTEHSHNGLGESNLIRLTPEEWEARKRRKMFRLISTSQ